MSTARTYSHREVLEILVGVLLGMFLAALDQTIVATALPTMASELHGGEHLAWIISAYLVTSTASSPIYGRLSDLYGRRSMLSIAIAVFVAASMLCGFAQTTGQLIAARALQGAGGGGLIALAQATVGDIIAPRERGRYQAYLSGTWAVASVGGPVLGGLFADYASWRWVFWINLPLGIIALVVSRRALRVLPVHAVRRRVDYLGAALLVAAVTILLLITSWGGTVLPWTSPTLLLLVALDLVLIAALVLWELRTREPIVPPRLFANPVFRMANLASTITAMAMFGGTVFLPLFLQFVAGASAANSGLLLVPFSIGIVAGALTSGKAMVRTGGYKRLPLAGLGAAVAAFLLIARLDAGSPFLLAILLEAAAAIGIGLTLPAMLVAVQNAVEPGDIGAATSGVAFFRSLGGSFGVAALGAVLAGSLDRHLAGTALAASATGELGPAILHGGPAAVLAMAEPLRSAVAAALAQSFQSVFLVCAGAAALSFAVTLRLPEVPLRSSADAAKEAAAE